MASCYQAESSFASKQKGVFYNFLGMEGAMAGVPLHEVKGAIPNAEAVVMFKTLKLANETRFDPILPQQGALAAG
jgi:hypothetical protein